MYLYGALVCVCVSVFVWFCVCMCSVSVYVCILYMSMYACMCVCVYVCVCVCVCVCVWSRCVYVIGAVSGIAYLYWLPGCIPTWWQAVSRPGMPTYSLSTAGCMLQGVQPVQSGHGLATALDSTLNTTQQHSYWSTNCQLF